MALIPVDPDITDIKLEVEDGEDTEFVTIRGIENIEVNIDKDTKNARELGELFQNEATSMVAPEISIGGHYVEDKDTSEVDAALEDLSAAAASGDDVRTIQIETPLYSKEINVRVTGDVSTEFKENYDWSFNLQQKGEGDDITS